MDKQFSALDGITFANSNFKNLPIHRLKTSAQIKPDKLRLVRFIANLMDNYFTIPGTNFKFGLDPIIGLLPIAGQIPTLAISLALVYTMSQYGASNKLIVKMTLNTLLDATVGSIPIIGTLFDFAYKANTKNVQLIEEHYLENKHTGSGRNILLIVFAIVFLTFGFICYFTYILINYLYHLIF